MGGRGSSISYLSWRPAMLALVQTSGGIDGQGNDDVNLKTDKLAKRDSGHQSLLPFGHSSTEILVRVSVGEKSQTELECSRSVVLISKFVLLCCYVRVPTPAAMAASRRAFHHKAIRRPEDRRIFTISPDERLLFRGDR